MKKKRKMGNSINAVDLFSFFLYSLNKRLDRSNFMFSDIGEAFYQYSFSFAIPCSKCVIAGMVNTEENDIKHYFP